jgi:segregation and condensation protein A
MTETISPLQSEDIQLFYYRSNSFTGSLSELAYALRSDNLSVHQLNVSQLVTEYLAYYRKQAINDLELATETLPEMARIIELKARFLLPRPAKATDEAIKEDVVEVVLELEAVENALLFLRQQRQARQHLLTAKTPRPDYPRPRRPLGKPALTKLSQLAARYQVSSYFELAIERLSIPIAMRRLTKLMRKLQTTTLRALTRQAYLQDVSEEPTADLGTLPWLTRVVYFAGMLELVKEGKLAVQQASYDSEIVLERPLSNASTSATK